MNNKLYYKGYTQYNNIGDLLINKSLLDHFRKHSDVIVSDEYMPDFYVNGLELHKKERITSYNSSFHLKLIIEGLKSSYTGCKVYYLASPPGHQFQSKYISGLKYFFSGFFYFFLKLIGVKIIKIGFSIGPLTKIGEIGESFRALFIPYYYVRDSISLGFVKHIRIKHAKYFPDLCWTFVPHYYNDEYKYARNTQSKIILSFREAVHGDAKDSKYEKELFDFFDLIIQKYKDIYQFEISYQVGSDFNFSERIYEKLKKYSNVYFNRQQIQLEEAEYYKTADFVITNRLHVALLAYKFNCLPIIFTDLIKHIKINGIFTDAGLVDLLINSKESYSNSIDKLDSLLNNKATYIEQFKAVEQTYMKESEQIMNKIFI